MILAIDHIEEHCNACLELLEQLATTASKQPLSRIEQSAAERQLQVLVEAAIGVAKHWVKAQSGSAPSDAYSSFEKLSQLGKLDQSELLQWRKIIGLRNALVHDYLNFSVEVLQRVLIKRQFVQAFQFIQKASAALR
jgi:uncharacterized protein YutE (UPF0331/DUF86 family)